MSRPQGNVLDMLAFGFLESWKYRPEAALKSKLHSTDKSFQHEDLSNNSSVFKTSRQVSLVPLSTEDFDYRNIRLR